MEFRGRKTTMPKWWRSRKSHKFPILYAVERKTGLWLVFRVLRRTFESVWDWGKAQPQLAETMNRGTNKSLAVRKKIMAKGKGCYNSRTESDLFIADNMVKKQGSQHWLQCRKKGCDSDSITASLLRETLEKAEDSRGRDAEKRWITKWIKSWPCKSNNLFLSIHILWLTHLPIPVFLAYVLTIIVLLSDLYFF